MAEKFEGVEQRHLQRTPISEVAFKEYGRSSYVRQTQYQAGVQAVILVPANPNRISLLLINNSVTDVYIGFTPDTSSTFGILVTANGGNFSMNLRNEGEAVNTEIYAISTVAGRNMTAIETIVQER